jgi:hypothetical protein
MWALFIVFFDIRGEPLVYQHYGNATTEKACKENVAELTFKIGDFNPKIKFICERFSKV